MQFRQLMTTNASLMLSDDWKDIEQLLSPSCTQKIDRQFRYCFNRSKNLVEIPINVSYCLNFDLITEVLYTSIMLHYIQVNYFVAPRLCPPPHFLRALS